MLWCEEISYFIEKFATFQKDYSGPKIRHSSEGLREMRNTCPKKNKLVDGKFFDYLNFLERYDTQFCNGESIIHEDILPKNIIRNDKGKLFLIDFERVKRGPLIMEAAASILYSFMGSGRHLNEIYGSFGSIFSKRLDIDLADLRLAIAHKAGEYLLAKSLGCYRGKTKDKEIRKAERFFTEAVGLAGLV
jgi:thiamine kinase-like enzyme